MKEDATESALVKGDVSGRGDGVQKQKKKRNQIRC